MSRKSLIGLLVLGVVALLFSGTLACGKSTSTGDITVTSSVAVGHTH